MISVNVCIALGNEGPPNDIVMLIFGLVCTADMSALPSDPVVQPNTWAPGALNPLGDE